MIARDVGLPVGAVRKVLQETPPQSSDTGETEPQDPYLSQIEQETGGGRGWPMTGRPTVRAPPSARELTAWSISDQLQRVLELSGLRKDAATLAVERFGYYRPDDYARLGQILQDLGAPQPVVRSSLGLYRELTGEPEKPFGETEKDDPNAKLKRQLQEDLESRLLMARIKAVEREAQAPTAAGGDPATAAKLSSLESMVANLTHTIESERLETRHRQELRDQEERHQRELAATRSAIPSGDEIDRKKALNAAELQAAALARGVDALGRRLDSAGGLQQLAKAAIGAATPEVTKLTTDSVRTLASAWRSEAPAQDPPNPAGVPSAEGLAVAAAMLAKVRGTA